MYDVELIAGISVVNDTNDTLVLQYCIAILCQSNINPGS